MSARALKPSSALPAAGRLFRLSRFRHGEGSLAAPEALWLCIVALLALVWLALAALAPREGDGAAAPCVVHGRAALVCRPDAPPPAPGDCESLGRGGRICVGGP